MTVTPIHQAALRRRIAAKMRQQAARWNHLADVLAVIAHHDTEIRNLQAQLAPDDGMTTVCRNRNAGAASPVSFAGENCCANQTNTSCPHTTTKPAQPAPIADSR